MEVFKTISGRDLEIGIYTQNNILYQKSEKKIVSFYFIKKKTNFYMEKEIYSAFILSSIHGHQKGKEGEQINILIITFRNLKIKFLSWCYQYFRIIISEKLSYVAGSAGSPNFLPKYCRILNQLLDEQHLHLPSPYQLHRVLLN